MNGLCASPTDLKKELKGQTWEEVYKATSVGQKYNAFIKLLKLKIEQIIPRIVKTIKMKEEKLLGKKT